mmetsp:Transcript_16062/g.15473  ORF Transcript_16062/g.15473 Transcript_16062/m.15473 type:complete len:128 (+) Transcript_16062:150-533(+)|eukprot:CAMPEP_0170557746 /NCGR_PEP_ID=MMETSP0211-20121228/29735_1 /TAXON_ID=311385 /ORGANISM="Pseudokeronopsis sp., Strain OXSARD2" /LENGTH=127 /DNA_ID=CAMNT_0010869041 /DNA_START=116 /DNA_END=499 /DNA_ORIENTATION=-
MKPLFVWLNYAEMRPRNSEITEAMLYSQIKENAQKIKTAAGYVGAFGIIKVCENMILNYTKYAFQEVKDYYPFLIEASVEFKVSYRRFIANQEGSSFELKETMEEVPLSKGYHIEKVSWNYYALFGE